MPKRLVTRLDAGPGRLSLCRGMRLGAAVCRWSRRIRGMNLGPFSQVSPANEKTPGMAPGGLTVAAQPLALSVTLIRLCL